MMKYMLLVWLLGTSLSVTPLKGMQLVGQAKLKVLFWDVYQSWLYNPSGQYKAQRYPMALKIRYSRDISAKDLLENTEEQWQQLGLHATQYMPWLQQVQLLWPDITQGDELLLVIDKNKQSRFYFNQTLLGQISDPEFGPGFISIWLSASTRYPKLRRQLIGEQ